VKELLNLINIKNTYVRKYVYRCFFKGKKNVTIWAYDAMFYDGKQPGVAANCTILTGKNSNFN